MTAESQLPVVAVVGGSGKEGKGLAYRLARAGYPVIIGSRSPDKAQFAVQELQQLMPNAANLQGASNVDAVQQATIVVLTVPSDAHAAILESIKASMPGRLLIDATVPLQPGKPTRVRMPDAGSAAQAAREILGEASEVAAAFHTISHEHLLKDDPMDCDVLVTGTSPEARGGRAGTGEGSRTSRMGCGRIGELIGHGGADQCPDPHQQEIWFPTRRHPNHRRRAGLMALVLTALQGFPIVAAGDDLAALIQGSLVSNGLSLEDGDVLVIGQKIVSKAEGQFVNLAEVQPSPRAIALARETQKDARLIELVLRESTRVVRTRPGLIIVEHRLGFVCANAGIDHSNVTGKGDLSHEWVLLLPKDPDQSAARIRTELEVRSGRRLGVLINDLHGRAWRLGTVGVCIGLSGVPPLVDERGWNDLFGYKLQATIVGVADELAAAASLVMGQAAEGTPVIHVRGFPFPLREAALQELLRPANEDLFR